MEAGMEAEDQDATIRTGGQTDGWEFRSDGSFDATENWRRIQNVHAQNEIAQGAEDPRTEPISVVQDMMDDAMQEDGMAVERATQILEARFLQWDRDEQGRRRLTGVHGAGAGDVQLYSSGRGTE